MGIISRFKDIMASNVNALLDKCEDPEKMIDQYIRNLEDDMGKVKAETASVMAEEKSAKRKCNECQEEIEKMGEYAKRAVTAGNDTDARQFLAKKTELTEKMSVLEQQYAMAADNAMKMRSMHDKLNEDVSSLRARRDTLKAKAKVAKTQERMNQMGSSVTGAGKNMAAFDRMEDKVNQMMDKADAMATLNQSVEENSMDTLAAKYASTPTNTEVDDELAKLKAEMGM